MTGTMPMVVIKAATTIILGLLLGVTVSACAKPTIEEISRAKSPDSKVEAIVERKNAHATTSFVYEIYIVPVGQQIDREKDLILRAERMEGLSARWKEPRFLEIYYTSGRVYSFRNFWFSENVENFNYIVEARLRPASDSFSLTSPKE